GASMFTAIVITRLVFDILLKNPARRDVALGTTPAWLRDIKMGVIPRAKLYVSLSLAVVLLSAGALIFKGPELGVDFTGGHVYQVKMQEAPDVEAIRSDLAGLGIDPRVQTLGG